MESEMWMLLAWACTVQLTETETSQPGACDEAAMRALVDQANHCEVAEDCVEIGSNCAVGCWALVNAAEEQAVRDAYGQWRDDGCEDCDFDCGTLEAITCEGGACVGQEFF